MEQRLSARIVDLEAIISSSHLHEERLRLILSSSSLSSTARVQASSALVLLLRAVGRATYELTLLVKK
jgi:hypothetical protein